MVFSSIIFLFAYLPLVLLVYHLIFLPVWRGSTRTIWRHSGNAFLLVMSLLFYFWGEKNRVWIFIATVALDYFCALLIAGAVGNEHYAQLTPGSPRTRFQKSTLAVSVCPTWRCWGFSSISPWEWIAITRSSGSWEFHPRRGTLLQTCSFLSESALLFSTR